MTDLLDDYDTRIPLPEGFTVASAKEPGNALVLSSTQFDTWDRCKRAWWASSWAKWPKPPVQALTFGTTLHAVCERWLKADDLGRDKDGKPVDLYPAGWDAAITPGEAVKIRQLVAQAIDKGVLVRYETREVEIDFLHFMDQVEHLSVFARGTIDVLAQPDLIEDHKTTGRMGYAKSPAKLGHANQPLLYGHDLLLRLMDKGEEFPERIQISHNYFCKDPDDLRVKKVWAKGEDGQHGVTPAEIEKRWDHFKTVAKEMVKLTKVSDWRQTPEPTNYAKACNAYGGCPYRNICSGRETVQNYTYRINQAQEKAKMNNVLAKNLAAAKAGAPAVPPAGPVTVNGAVPAAKPAAAPRPAPKPPTKKVDTRKFFALSPETGEPYPNELTFEDVYKLIGDLKVDLQLNESGTQDWKAASEVGGFEVALAMNTTAETVPVTPTPAAPLTKTVVEPPKGQRVAPWASDKCTACKTNEIRGFNSKGAVCRICESFYGKAVTLDYTITTDEGKIDWVKAGENATATETAETVGDSTPVEAEGTTEGASGDAGVTSAVSGAKRGRGRPPGTTNRKGFTLLIGVSCSKGYPSSVQLDDFLANYGKRLAEISSTAENMIESYYDLDPFQRRDKIAREAPKIAAELGNSFVFVRNATDPDMRSLVLALSPHAGTIFEAAK